MRSKLSFTPTIAKPCEESWEAMDGGARARHCARCAEQVHNFAAMTAREIEKVVRATGGKLCARITQREDGSLVMLETRPGVPFAAQIAASAVLVAGAAGMSAQSSEKSPAAHGADAAKCVKPPSLVAGSTFIGQIDETTEPGLEPNREVLSERIGGREEAAPGQAILTGTVLKPDASGPEPGAIVSLRASSKVVATVKADDSGRFRIVAPSGTYDILIRQNMLFGARIVEAKLHEGEQSLQNIRIHFDYHQGNGSPYDGVVMGEIAIDPAYTFSSALRHPMGYLKHLFRKA
jgi:hypothetical protein